MSHGVYITSVYIHIVSACLWLGGMLFLMFAFIPGIKNHPEKADLIAKVSLKFRNAGTVALVLLLITGITQLEYRGVQWRWDYFTGSYFGKLAGYKILVFAGIVAISGIHDYYLGNLAVKLWKENPDAKHTKRIRSISRSLGRLAFVLAAVAVFIGVLMVRGW